MATLVLGIAGGALGSAFGPAGAVLGRAAGALAGYTLDQALFGTRRKVEGPRLSDLGVQASTEGAPIPRIYGRARLSGEIIWATKFEEVSKTETQSGGKGGGPQVTTTEYSYFANFAVALCGGEITRIGRIWADGNPLDQSRFTFRVYSGDETQLEDSLILAKDGEGPAYRGVAYVVFERMPLADFGNRLPQLSFEVFRPVAGIEEHVRAVCVIPGSTEFGYDPLPVARVGGPGVTLAENVHAVRDVSDWTVSIDELQSLCPSLEWVTLVVAWFGDDLRAAHCTVRPKVDSATKVTSGATWSASGLTRASAETVSLVEGRPAYGGSPSDLSVVRAIQAEGARAEGDAGAFHPDGYRGGQRAARSLHGSGGAGAYPWRGRITCDPAPGEVGSPDKTAAASADVASFLGVAEPGDFSVERQRRFVFRAGRVELSAHGASPRASCGACRRRRRVPDRLGAARADDASLRREHLSLRRRAEDARRRRARNCRRRNRDLLRGGLERVFRSSAGRRIGRCLLPSRSAVERRCNRFRRHRSLSPADRLARRARPSGRDERALALQPRLSGRKYPRRRRLRLVLRERRRPRRADPHADRRRRLRQALGVPLQGHRVLVGTSALRPPRRRGSRNADRLGAGGQADPADRTRLPGDRQGCQPAERVLRSEVVGIGGAVLLQRRARRLPAAHLHRRLSALLRYRPPAFQRVEPGVERLRRAHDRPRAI